METIQMEELKYLEKLYKVYTKKAKSSGHWADYLKAHGILNACMARENNATTEREIYDLETAWYGDNHPLSYKEYQTLTQKHRKHLNIFRNDTNKNVAGLEAKQRQLSVDDMFDEENLKLASELSDDVFQMSKKCSDDFVKFSHSIVESSVDALTRIQQIAPCPFAVIGLGSVARGEATPYSDLEYAFIVENDSDSKYFTKLAIDSYFRIGNLSETPLKTFNIAELQETSISSRTVVGYRIDGITDMAGNIPTGKPGGQSLILTVDKLLDLYNKSANTPLGDRPGGFSDLLSASVLLYANNGGDQLYSRYKRLLENQMQASKTSQFAIEKRLKTILMDVKYFNFLPEFKSFGPPDNTNVQVKSDIFRFPTLLVNHLRLLASFVTQYPWDVLHKLRLSGFLSKKNHNNLKIVLAFSILIRTSAYLKLGSQSEQLSLYTSSSKLKQGLYHVPRDLFVTLGCLLIPIKLSINQFLESSMDDRPKRCVNVDEVTRDLLRSFSIMEQNVMLKVEVFYFAGDFDGSLDTLNSGLGKYRVDNMTFAVSCLMQGSGINASRDVCKYVEIICFLLISARRYNSAIIYLNWLAATQSDRIRWKVLFADCLSKVNNYQDSAALLNELILHLREELNLEPHQPFSRHLSNMLASGSQLSDSNFSWLEDAAHAFRVIADTFQALALFEETEQILQLSIQVFEFLISKVPDAQRIAANLEDSMGGLYFDKGDYQKSLEFYGKALRKLKTLHGEHTNQQDIATIYSNIGRVHKAKSQYEASLEYYNMSLLMLNSIHEKNSQHFDIAKCLCCIGSLYSDIGKNSKSLDYFNRALRLLKKNRSSVDIAECYLNMANVFAHIGGHEHKRARKLCSRALNMVAERTGVASRENHLALARLYNSISDVFSKIGDFSQALKYSIASLGMTEDVYASSYQELIDNLDIYLDIGIYSKILKSEFKSSNKNRFTHGRNISHPDIANNFRTIAHTYKTMGIFSEALQYASKSLNMMHIVHGENTAHLDLVSIHSVFGSVYLQMGAYIKALESYTKSLDIAKAIFGHDVPHSVIAACLNNIGIFYDMIGEHSKALCYSRKSLAMRKALYGETATNLDIAFSHNLIGVVYNDMGQYDKSLEHCMKSLNMRKAISGDNADTLEIANCYHNIAEAFRFKGNVSMSLEFHHKALNMRKNIYGDRTDHPEIAQSYNNIGNMYSNLNNTRTALEYHTKSLNMVKSLYGETPNPANLSMIYFNIGGDYLHMGQYAKSLECLMKSLELRKKAFVQNPNHPDILNGYILIGMVYSAMGENSKSKEYMTKALSNMSAPGQHSPLRCCLS